MEVPCKDIQSSDNALYIEHNVQRIITKQEIDGVFYNKAKASFYIHVLREHQARLYNQIRPHLKLVVQTPYNTHVSKPFLKSGLHSASVKAWWNFEDIPDISGQFTRVSFTEPDLGQRSKLIAQLIRLGWKPRHYTEKGNPQITFAGEPCKSLLKIDNNIGRWISEWYTCRHRASQIEGLNRICRPDGRISAQAITIGTPTFRFRHKGLVNIPRNTSFFGKHMRGLFGVKDKRNRRLVGWDAGQLELRILAHYINDEDFSKEVNDGDIHERNKRDAGLVDRDTAKTFIYAFIFGARDGKIGEIAGKSRAIGKKIRQAFLLKNPKLQILIEEVELAAARGFLQGLDGRNLVIRLDKFTGKPQISKGLNTLVQGGGATVMKWAMVLVDEWITELKLDAFKVIDMHDENQYDCEKRVAEMVGKLGVLSVVTAGKMLELNIPLAADYKIGTNWSQTH